VKPNALVSIVIVNYNGEAFLKGCLDSVLAQTYAPFEVIVVDNGSVDSSTKIIERGYPAVRILPQKENLGFSGGNNAGVREARGDLVVLLNNDTIVEQGWLEGLVLAAQEPGVAIVSSLILTEGIPAKYYERNGSINLLCHNVMRVYAKAGSLFYGGGASLLFKKNLMGLPFDDDYFAYVEDMYLGLRARFMGWNVIHTNASVVKHLGGATARRQRRAFVPFLQERNRILTTLLFFSTWTLVRAFPYIVLNVVAKLLLAVFTRKFSLSALLKAYGWLMTHPVLIWRKRQNLKRERCVRDAEVLSWMTCKLTNGESAPGRAVNAVSKIYCAMVGLRTIEFLPEGSR